MDQPRTPHDLLRAIGEKSPVPPVAAPAPVAPSVGATRGGQEPRIAVLLMAHGSRRESANADLVQLAQFIRETDRYPIVEIGYLELTTPTIDHGGRSCVARGATIVRMLPFFLSAGEHVLRDLEGHRRALSEEFPEVRFDLCPPIGLHPLITTILLDRLTETLV